MKCHFPVKEASPPARTRPFGLPKRGAGVVPFQSRILILTMLLMTVGVTFAERAQSLGIDVAHETIKLGEALNREQTGCVARHNSRPDGPKTDWKVGDVRGILEVIRPLDSVGAGVANLWDLGTIAGTLGAGLIGFALALRSLRRSSESLKQSEERVRAIIDSALDAVVTIDSAGLITDWNPQAEAMLGWTHQEAIGRTISETIIPHQYRAAHDLGLRHFLAGGEGPMLNQRIEITALRRDGRDFPIELSITPLRAGEAVSFAAFIRDISARKTADESLRDSEEKFRQLAENIADVFYMTSPDLQQMHYVSPAYERIWGRSAASLYAHPQEWVEAILPEDRERVWTTFGQLAASESSTSAEFRIVRPDGDLRWILSRGYQVRDVAGNVIRITGVASDITERKQAEAELEKTNKELLETSRQAGMAEVATSVLHNVGNVLNSVNIASSCVADSLRSSKAANLSKVVTLLTEHEHDLGDFVTNDPKGRQLPVYLAQLAEHLAGEQAGALKQLAQLQENIEHIKDIVRMQQSFSKASGVTELVNVAELVEDALRMNASGLAQRGIQVIKQFNDTPLVTADKHKMLQILVNLVRNAKQACEGLDLHERRVTIRTTNGTDGVRIAVCDNGMGILLENLPRVFSHGFTTKKDGHGFGLHTGALSAREMGGSLTVQSDGPGQGATFTLELPYTVDEEQGR